MTAADLLPALFFISYYIVTGVVLFKCSPARSARGGAPCRVLVRRPLASIRN
jgi:hypothetical protein